MTFPTTERVLAVSDVLLVSDVKALVGLEVFKNNQCSVLLLNISQILLIRTEFIRLSHYINEEQK